MDKKNILFVSLFVFFLFSMGQEIHMEESIKCEINNLDPPNNFEVICKTKKIVNFNENIKRV